MSREPAPEELRANVLFLEGQKAFHSKAEGKSGPSGPPGLLALNDLCAVILNLNEFVYIN